jgi:hypothetical protein
MDKRTFRTRDSISILISFVLLGENVIHFDLLAHLMCIFRVTLCDIRQMKYVSLFLDRCYSHS